MYIVVYEFVVKEGKEAQFLSSWPKVTQGIYLLKGSLGSRLHRSECGKWIAYAQWPDKETFLKSGEIEMTPEYAQRRKEMHDSLNLESTKALFQMEVESDYLQNRVFEI